MESPELAGICSVSLSFHIRTAIESATEQIRIIPGLGVKFMDLRVSVL